MPEKVKIDRKLCRSTCDLCVGACPVDVLRKPEDGQVYVAYPEDCQVCFLCQEDCPYGAITISSVSRFPMVEAAYGERT